MSDENKNTQENHSGNNGSTSLFLYTALIFLAAIIIIIFAYFAQTNVARSQPSASSETTAPLSSGSPSATEAGGPQGIAKTAAELSQDNLELLEENRKLHNKVDEIEADLKIYEPLIEAYHAVSTGDTEIAEVLIEEIEYNSLSDEAKTLYDYISSNIQ